MKKGIISFLLKLLIPIVLVYYVVKYFLTKKNTSETTGTSSASLLPLTGNISKDNTTNTSIKLPILTDEFANPFTVPSYRNLLRSFPVQTGTNLDLSHFGTVNARYYADENNYLRPVWGVYWDLLIYPFSSVNKQPWECGFAGTTNINTAKDGVEYVDTPEEANNYANFTSTIPYQYRTHSQYGVGVGVEPWVTGTDEDIYELGRSIGQSNQFGGGDNIYGLTKRQFVAVDIENSLENGSRKHRIFISGVLSRTFGFVSSLYSGIINELGYIEDQATGLKKYYNYPDEDGNYSAQALNVINEDWKLETTTSLSSKDIVGLRIPDFKNAIPCNEQSFYFEEVAPQGSHYPLNLNGDYVLVNKFGPNKTVRNPLCHLVTALQWQSYYCYYKLNKHRNMFMPKMVCDRGPLGKNPFSKSSTGAFIADTLPEHTNQNVGRKYAFLFTIALFMNDMDGWLWDRAVEQNAGGMDTYGGVAAAIEMLDNLGAIEIKRELVPEFWSTEYSLDNGVTWKKSYAIDWDTSTTDVLGVLITKSVTKVLLTAFRPEGFEPLAFIARTQIGTAMKYFKVGINDWESVQYEDDELNLNEIPNANKTIYCQMFDV